MFNETEFRSKIPYQQDTKQYELYASMIPALRQRKQKDKPRILAIVDIGRDYDDLVAIVILNEMHRMGVITLAGLVANHEPPVDRAKFLRTIQHLLENPDVPVAFGTSGTEEKKYLEGLYYELRNSTFIKQAWNEEPLLEGKQLIDKLAKQTDEGKEPLTVVLTSSLQDISEYFNSYRNDPNFCKSHFKKFISQGGYTVESDGSLKPIMNMTNNGFHPVAAHNYTKYLTNLKLPSDAWSRYAATASAMDGKDFQSLKDYGPIGDDITWVRDRLEFKFYWDPIHSPFMPHLNADWYLKTRLGLKVDSIEFKRMQEKLPTFSELRSMVRVILYDACAAVGALGDDLLKVLDIMGNLPSYNTAAHEHRIFGNDAEDLGGINAEKLRQAVSVFLFGGMKATYKNAEKLIPTETIEYDAQRYKIGLDIFKKQLPFLNELKQCEAQLKATGDQKFASKIQSLKNGELVDTNDNLVLDSEGKPYPKVPNTIPYELLYQEAMGNKKFSLEDQQESQGIAKENFSSKP